jgi:AAA ATPase domain
MVGRDEELAAIAAFLDGAGSGTALLLEGEAGIGKTTVWRAGVRAAAARGLRTLRAQPAESEAVLSFTALADLLGDVLDGVREELPSPQRRALDAALLLEDAGASSSDARAVAAAVPGVLRRVAGTGPLLVAVDDIQWLDAASADALVFAARRLDGEPVDFLLARRAGDDPRPLGLDRAFDDARMDRIAIGPLALDALYRLLRDRLGTTLSRPTLRRVHELSGGNPLFALELAREPERRATGGKLAGTAATLIDRRIGALLEDTKRLTTMAAALALGLTAAAVALAGGANETTKLRDLSLELVGQVQNSAAGVSPATSAQYGYVSDLDGLPIFAAELESQTTALLTFYTDTTTTRVVDNGAVRIVNRVGTLTIYDDPAPNGSFADPSTFRDGTAVLVAGVRQQVIVDTATGAFTARNVNTILSTTPFSSPAGTLQIGKTGERFRTVIQGRLNSPGPPSAYMAGYAYSIR